MLTETIRQQILTFISELNSEVFVVHLELKEGRSRRLILLVDTDDGINMATVGEVNRKVGRWLDEENLLDFEYAMEVSSPGIGEPFVVKRQYNKNIGRDIRILLKAGGEVFGQLTSMDDEGVLITPYLKKNYNKGQKPILAEEGKIVTFDKILDSRVII
jgi:ribosome maturation factor RimP